MTVSIFDALALGVDSLKEAAGLTVAELRDRGLTLADAKFNHGKASGFLERIDAESKGIEDGDGHATEVKEASESRWPYRG